MKKKPNSSKTLKTPPSRKRSPKKIPRKKEKLWGLEPLTFPKAAQEFIGIDEQYKKDLMNDPKAAAFLSKFHDEVYGNKFRKGKGAKNLHVKDARKEIYDGTNARNRDMYNRRYRYQDIEYVASMEASDTANPTEAIIDYIDKKKKIKAFYDELLGQGVSVKEAQELTSYIFNLESI